MPRVVVINAMCGGFPEEAGEGVEIWGVNRTFHVEPRVDRIYFFDPHTLFAGDLLSDLAALDIPVFTREAVAEIPRSAAFPIEELKRFFGGLEYWTCSIAYMVAHAIYEHCTGKRIDTLILNGMFHPRDSMEYLWSKPCVEFWVGVAMGHGMNVQLYGYNALCKPLPWETGLYGYTRNVNAELCILTLAAAYKACYSYPREFRSADDELLPPQDLEGLMRHKAVLQQRMESVENAIAAISPEHARSATEAACA